MGDSKLLDFLLKHQYSREEFIDYIENGKIPERIKAPYEFRSHILDSNIQILENGVLTIICDLTEDFVHTSLHDSGMIFLKPYIVVRDVLVTLSVEHSDDVPVAYLIKGDYLEPIDVPVELRIIDGEQEEEEDLDGM